MAGSAGEVAGPVGTARASRATPIPGRRAIAPPAPSTPAPPSLPCRTPSGTCAACCRAPGVPADEAALRIRRHTAWARRLGTARGGPLRHVLHEVASRRGADLVAAPLLLLPFVGPALRARLAARAVCAFLAFDDGDETRVGCLLHPARRPGPDVRPRAAYRLLRGLGCGDPSWVCPAARAFAAAPPRDRRAFARAAPEPWTRHESRIAGRFDAPETPQCP